MNPRRMTKLHVESVDLYISLLQHKNAKASLFLRAVKRARRRYRILYSYYGKELLSFNDLHTSIEYSKHAEKHVNTIIFSQKV